MTAQQTLQSPRLFLLQQVLTSGDTTALEVFWQEISENGSPLMEAIEGDKKHYLVTFLWHGKEDTQNVAIWGGPAGLDHPEDHRYDVHYAEFNGYHHNVSHRGSFADGLLALVGKEQRT